MVLEAKYPQSVLDAPQPDLYLSAASPHPLQKYGCTICHDGQGSGTSFKDASHTANNPHEYEVWHQKHHYDSNHFWEYPDAAGAAARIDLHQVPSLGRRIGCSSEVRGQRPKLYKGYNLIKEYGCFGCHEIQGFDGTRPIGPDLRLEPSTEAEAAKIAADPTQIAGTMRKVGPSLRHVGKKLTPSSSAIGSRSRSGSARRRGCRSSSTPQTWTTRWPSGCSRSSSPASPTTSRQTAELPPAEAGAGLQARSGQREGSLLQARLPRLPQSRGVSRFTRDLRPRAEQSAREDPSGRRRFCLGLQLDSRSAAPTTSARGCPTCSSSRTRKGASRSIRRLTSLLSCCRRGPEKFPTPSTPQTEFDTTLNELVKLNLSKH